MRAYSKQKNVPEAKRGEFGVGNVWTWTAIDADSKLCVSWLVGDRDADTAREFMEDVAQRLQYRVQLTTDGHGPYLQAVDLAFGNQIDYVVLQKLYGKQGDAENPETRYSPGECTGHQEGDSDRLP